MNKKLMIAMVVVGASALYVRFQVVGMEADDQIYQAEERRRAAGDAERAAKVPGAEASEISTGPSAEIVNNNYAQMFKYEISKHLSLPPKVMAFLCHKLCIPNRIQTNRFVSSVVFSPDGKLLATGSDGKLLAKGSDDGTAAIWDVASRNRVQTLQRGSFAVSSVAFSPDGRLLATGSEDRTAGIWDVARGNRLKTLQHGRPVSSVSFSSDGKLLATGSDVTVGIWNVASGNRVQTLQCGTDVNSAAFSPDGRLLASGSIDGKVGIWNVATGQRLQTLQCDGSVSSVAFSPDGKLLATGGSSGKFFTSHHYGGIAGIWDVATGQRLQTLQRAGHVYSVAFSPDGKLLATGSADVRVVIWNVESGQRVYAFQHYGLVNSVAFSPDGKLLATASARIVFLWNVECFQALERSTITTAAQYKLMEAFESALRDEQNGTVRIVGKINVTSEQWATFETLPENMQEALRPLIRNEREQKKVEDWHSKQEAAAAPAISQGKEEEEE